MPRLIRDPIGNVVANLTEQLRQDKLSDYQPLILSLDTATQSGGICLAHGEAVLAARAGDASKSHSCSLLSEIDLLLKSLGARLDQVELFAASAGPGSFTGLRIGLASVKAFSTTLRRPCFGIPTLSAVAHAAGDSAATVAVLPAGRGEVFAQLFAVSSRAFVTALDAPAHLPPMTMLEKYARLPNLKWAGEGAGTLHDMIENYAASRGIPCAPWSSIDGGWTLSAVEKSPAAPEENLAIDIAALALHRFQAGESEYAESLEPIYVRPSDPELKKYVNQ